MMSATARDIPGANLDETIAHEPNPQSGPDRPMGSSEMPTQIPTPQGHRYTYGSGARPLDGYTIKRAIGRGGFGEVYYATSDSGKEVALKLILRNLEVERRGVVQCMNLKCPNLLTIYDLKSNDAGESFVIMEYVAGPSLANVLAKHPRGLPPAEVRAWLKGLVEGVAYLHDHGIVHRDLKPANIFMEEGIVKIGDYGLAKLITAGQVTEHSESIGTCHYMAPEIASGKYDKPIDIYAMGIILFEMITGRVPFEGESVGEVLMKHLTARPDLSGLPAPYQAIVARALAKDPKRAPGARLRPAPPGGRAPGAERPLHRRGEGHAPPAPGPEARARPPREREEIFRIGAEEPVFYIGPETRPPQSRRTLPQRIRQTLAAARPRRAGAAPRRPTPMPTPAAPAAPAEPPPLPGGRVRVAELAMSMLRAALLAALFSVPASGLLGVDFGRPQQLAYLFGLTLLGTWGTLLFCKPLEGRSADPMSRRVVFLMIGLALGGVGSALAWWTRLDLEPAWHLWVIDDALDLPRWAGSPGHPNPLVYAIYFGLAFFAIDWWKLAARDRKARFRVVPVVKTGLIGLLLGLLWPVPPALGPRRARPDRRDRPAGQPLERGRRRLRPREQETQAGLTPGRGGGRDRMARRRANNPAAPANVLMS